MNIENYHRNPDVNNRHENGGDTHSYNPPFGEIHNVWNGVARDREQQTADLVKNQILPGTVLTDDIRNKHVDLQSKPNDPEQKHPDHPPSAMPPELKPGQPYEGATDKHPIQGAKEFVLHPAKPL